MSKSKKFISNGLIYLLSSIITQLINLFLIPIYTHNLSTGKFGQYNLVSSMQSLLSIGITLGVYSGMSRFFNEYEDKNKLKNVALTFSLLWGSVCIILSFMVSPILANIVFKADIDGDKYIIFIFIISVMTCIISIYGSYLSMQFKAIKSSSINIVNMILTFVFAFYFVAILKYGIVGILKAQCLAQSIIIIFLFLIDIKNIKFCLKYKELMSMLKYGAGLCPGQISSWVLTLIDRYFIKYFVSLSAVGIYSMAYKIGMLINPLFILPFQAAFTPFKYSVYKEVYGKVKIKNIFKYYNFIGWFCVLGLALYGKFFIQVLATSEYIVGFKLIPLIALSYFLWGVSEFYALGLHIANKVLQDSAIVTIAAIINVILNIILIPYIGMYGAAISTIIAYVAANAMYFYFGKKYYDLEVSIFDPYKYGVVVLIIYAIYLFFQMYIFNMFLEFIFNILLCICYLYTCIKLNFISYKNVKSIILKTKIKIINKINVRIIKY